MFTVIRSVFAPLTGLLLSATVSSVVFAQSTPSEFAEMSLQDLFSASTEDSSDIEDKWSWSLRYQQAEFEGYLDGSNDLSFDDVLFTPGEEPRTDKNFPVVPTVIMQRATILGIQYQWNKRWHGSLAVPYIQQETDHISIVPGYDEFLIKSRGVGDVSFNAGYLLAQQNNQQWQINIGLSIPTGSIDEQGDTPRAPGNQQLPYTMQLGSGTLDIPLSLSYQSTGQHKLSLDAMATIRTGNNDRDYRLGDRYGLKGKYRHSINDSLSAVLGAEVSHSKAIHGADQSLLVPQAIPYPASITNPDLYGGTKVLLSAGFRWQFAEGYNLSFEFAKPVYQHLNGPQPQENWRGGLAISSAI